MLLLFSELTKLWTQRFPSQICLSTWMTFSSTPAALRNIKTHLSGSLTAAGEQVKKCEFHVTSIPFLGFIFECGQMKADPVKTQAVEVAPILPSFNRWFIQNSSTIADPLTALTL